jgi:hypothetical protein
VCGKQKLLKDLSLESVLLVLQRSQLAAQGRRNIMRHVVNFHLQQNHKLNVTTWLCVFCIGYKMRINKKP